MDRERTVGERQRTTEVTRMPRWRHRGVIDELQAERIGDEVHLLFTHLAAIVRRPDALGRPFHSSRGSF